MSGVKSVPSVRAIHSEVKEVHFMRAVVEAVDSWETKDTVP
jgi:hypothetical protein